MLVASVFLTTTSSPLPRFVTTERVDTVVTRGENVVLDMAGSEFSREVDIKTNLLEDLVGTMSLGAEVRLAPRLSLSLSGLWNPWTFTDYTMYKQWSVRPQLRWWPGAGGHSLSFGLMGGEYNYSRVRLPFNAAPDLRGHRYEGWFLGGGVTYGYRYNVSRLIALETTIGFGVAHLSYTKYACGKCGERVGKGTRVYVGPIDAAVNLIVRLGGTPPSRKTETRVETVNSFITRTIERERIDTVFLAGATVVDTVHSGSMLDIKHSEMTLRLQYALSSSAINPELGNNRAQIDSLERFITRYLEDPTVRIASIDIVGYASLEGASAANRRLSQARAEAAARLISDLYPSLSGDIEAKGMGEDWDTPQFEGKARLMAVRDLDERERLLRKIDGGTLFERLLHKSLPLDRRIECIINYTTVTNIPIDK